MVWWQKAWDLYSKFKFESGCAPLVRSCRNSRGFTHSSGPTKYTFRKVRFTRIQKKSYTYKIVIYSEDDKVYTIMCFYYFVFSLIRIFIAIMISQEKRKSKYKITGIGRKESCGAASGLYYMHGNKPSCRQFNNKNLYQDIYFSYVFKFNLYNC